MQLSTHTSSKCVWFIWTNFPLPHYIPEICNKMLKHKPWKRFYFIRSAKMCILGSSNSLCVCIYPEQATSPHCWDVQIKTSLFNISWCRKNNQAEGYGLWMSNSSHWSLQIITDSNYHREVYFPFLTSCFEKRKRNHIQLLSSIATCFKDLTLF